MTVKLDLDTQKLLAEGDCNTLAIDVSTCREQWAKDRHALSLEITVINIERDRLKALNDELLATLKELLTTLSMGPLEFAATYGPDADSDEMLNRTAKQARDLIAKAQEVSVDDDC